MKDTAIDVLLNTINELKAKVNTLETEMWELYWQIRRLSSQDTTPIYIRHNDVRATPYWQPIPSVPSWIHLDRIVHNWDEYELHYSDTDDTMWYSEANLPEETPVVYCNRITANDRAGINWEV